MKELRREVIIAQGHHRVNQRGVHKIGTGREGIIEETNKETPAIRNPMLLKR